MNKISFDYPKFQIQSSNWDLAIPVVIVIIFGSRSAVPYSLLPLL
ncbi:hypothetical protein [Moorena sp. SIO3I8]|nr:hypothetical protein [Moorena sp. SIO3I8]